MKKILCIVLFMSGCASAVDDNSPLVETPTTATAVKHDDTSVEEDFKPPVRLPTKLKVNGDTPRCTPDTFMADAIPPGYQLDPNCPPIIIWPPSFIWPNDPGPIINPPTNKNIR